MNFGELVKRGMRKAELDINSIGELQIAREEANDLINELWYTPGADFRKKSATITTADGTDEYLVDKNFDEMVRGAFRGPSGNPRHLKYLNPQKFYSKFNDNVGNDSTPLYWTLENQQGVDADLSSASVIKVSSSLTTLTTGTVKVVDGSPYIEFSALTLTRAMVGYRFQVSGDSKYYELGEFISSSKAKLTERFRGTSDTAASYSLGDIGIACTISGVVGGQNQTEQVILNGATKVSTTKTFASVTEVTKEDYTGGIVTFENNAEDETIGTLAPNETDLERVKIKLYPKPTGVEVLSYEFLSHHPILKNDSDRILIPKKYHPLLKVELEMRLKDWADRPISASLGDLRDRLVNQFHTDINTTRGERIVAKEEGISGYGDQYYYNHDEDF